MAKLEGKKIVMIIARENFRDEELQKPQAVFENEGAKVTIASSTLEQVKGSYGAKARPELLLDKVRMEDYDAVVFVGGIGSSEYFDNPRAHEIARQAYNQGKVVAAICIAPSTLANAGLLKGKKATCYVSENGNLKNKGAIYTGRDVERDGKIITANGPQAAEEFGKAIVSALAE